jgi:hypothetical protein
MARILTRPDPHHEYGHCRQEVTRDCGLDEPVGTIAECSCGKRFVMSSSQFDGKLWEDLPTWNGLRGK